MCRRMSPAIRFICYKEFRMILQRLWLFIAVGCLLSEVCAQELNLSVAAKTYTAREQVWVNISVIGAAAVPGAYSFKLGFDPAEMAFMGVLPSADGPFSITPAVSTAEGVLSVAGFQGITDTGKGSTSLVTVVFTPAKSAVAVDTATFEISGNEVFSAQAQKMELTLTRQMTSVRLPLPQQVVNSTVTISNGYVRFMVRNSGVTSVRIYDMNGRTVALPLAPTSCPSGFQAVPFGRRLGSGVYIVAVNGAGMHLTKKLEVVR